MDNYTYQRFQQAKKNRDLSQMKKLYTENKNDYIIALEYAKLLTKGIFKNKSHTFLTQI